MMIPVLGSLLIASAAHAGEPDAIAANRIAGELMSPFCKGRTLAACSSGRAVAWRDDIETWVEADVSETEIRDRLAARVPGFRLSSSPPGAWSWLLPVGALGMVTLFMLAVWRSATRSRTHTPTVVRDAVPNDLQADLRRELEELD